MTEREFWSTVRQALLLFVSAIERRYKFGKHSETTTQEVGGGDNTTFGGVV